MSERTYNYHTVKIGERINITATQKYTDLDGEPYYLASFDYAIFDHQHLIATGSIQGSGMEKISEVEVQPVFDRVLDHRRKHGN